MSENVIELFPSGNIAQSLRNIADQIESGEIHCKNCTLIANLFVYQLGEGRDDREASATAIFNMTYGIHRLMAPCVDAARGLE